jgi:FkbM family methyltransferase
MPHSILQSAGHQLRRCVHSLISNSLRLCGFGTLMETFSRLERLETIVAKEIDRLDGYLVYHADRLSEQIDKLNKISYLHADLDALLVTGEFDLLIPTSEPDLLNYITYHGLEAIEPGVRAVLQARLHPGGTAVDIGANVGVHALTMAKKVGPSGRVVCMEPAAHIASTLERTLRLNGFSDRSQVICSGAAHAAGEATLHRGSAGPGSSAYLITIALDDHFAPGERVDLVKIDVKGMEPAVYKGMARILGENPEIELILKWSASDFARFNQSPESFWESIRNDGFKRLLIDDQQPGPLVTLQEAATVPDPANILLTRKHEVGTDVS